jgi:hypothetical protein
MMNVKPKLAAGAIGLVGLAGHGAGVAAARTPSSAFVPTPRLALGCWAGSMPPSTRGACISRA